MTDQPQGQEKKIIIDEDWKSQVQAEKEAARRPGHAEPAGQPPRLPPADLTFLASTLYLQGMVSLGLIPNPIAERPKVQLDQAQHSIDTLQVLYDKTAGNRTPTETDAMDHMLHELRLAFLAVRERTNEGGGMKDEG